MKTIRVKAHAKINLTLDVLGKREDGFHEVEMIMQSIELHDTITITRGGENIVITGDSSEIPLDQNNLAYRAAAAIMERAQIREGVNINIIKRIPVAAGLAGGSTDAAATLTGINELFSLGFTREELMEIGAGLGSDVPFCIMGGTALATGRGELVRPLSGLPEMPLVLAKPNIGVPTALIYNNFDPAKVRHRPDTGSALQAIEKADTAALISNLANVLESVTLNLYPQVQQVKKLMAESGIKNPLMSGSGPSVFGFAASHEEARAVAAGLMSRIPFIIATYTV